MRGHRNALFSITFTLPFAQPLPIRRGAWPRRCLLAAALRPAKGEGIKSFATPSAREQNHTHLLPAAPRPPHSPIHRCVHIHISDILLEYHLLVALIGLLVSYV